MTRPELAAAAGRYRLEIMMQASDRGGEGTAPAPLVRARPLHWERGGQTTRQVNPFQEKDHCQGKWSTPNLHHHTSKHHPLKSF